MVNINYTNVQRGNDGIQLRSTAPASVTHRHSAQRPAAPSSGMSVLEKMETRGACMSTQQQHGGENTTQRRETKPVVLTISRSYGLNFHPHFRSPVRNLALDHPTKRAEAGGRDGLTTSGWAQLRRDAHPPTTRGEEAEHASFTF